MPLFSVIIPCYNAKKSIVRCIDSLVNQTFQDFDVILIDDCSQDDTFNFLKQYIQNVPLDIKLLKNIENSGPAFSRNVGIAASESIYIAFCDSDDWYENNYLQLMYDIASTQNADIVFCNSRRVFSNGKYMLLNNISGIPKDGSMKDVLVTGVDSLGSMVVKRSIISKCHIPNLRNGEDMAVIPVLIANSKKFGFTEGFIYNYYYTGNSLSTRVSQKVVDSLLESFAFIENHLSDDLRKECEFLGVRNVLYGALLNAFKVKYQPAVAKEIIQNFERKYPDWNNNQYLYLLPRYKRLFLKLIKKRIYFGVWCMALMHTLLLKLGLV
ncbi:glycosyltransferase family 2 protein [Cytobacillus gottheilii]|uniref:glycosyltransferase family 2 protein n=1 Tax=Cytobacillus gottheilii TaxID=859144 RepID=UPI0009BB1BA7|nr:glycosyltransferase family A protein [Cytobacillus gottheilii]